MQKQSCEDLSSVRIPLLTVARENKPQDDNRVRLEDLTTGDELKNLNTGADKRPKTESNNTWQDIKRLMLFGGYNSGAAVIGAATNFISVKFIADYDPNLLAASGLISAMQNFVYYFSSGCLCSTAILISKKMHPDANDEDKADIGRIARQSWLLSGIISIPTTLLTIFSGSLLKLCGQDSEPSDATQEYFRASACMPAYFLMVCNTQIAMGLQKPQVIFWTFLAQRALLIGFACPLMFGVSNTIPAYGISGLGYANTISIWTTLIGTTGYIAWLAKKEPSYEIFNFRKSGGWNIFKELVRFGMPISLKIGIDLAATQMLILMAGWLNKDMLISFEIALQYMFLLTLPATNLGQASGVLIGNTLATGDSVRVRRYANTCTGLSIALPAVALVLFFAVPRPLISVFVDEQDERSNAIITTTTHLLWLTAAGLPDSLRSAFEGSLRGVSDTTFAMFSGLINNLLLAVPFALAAYLENNSADNVEAGVCGIFAARTACMVSCTLSLALRWFYKASTITPTTATSTGLKEVKSVQTAKPPTQSCWSWIKSCFWSTPSQENTGSTPQVSEIPETKLSPVTLLENYYPEAEIDDSMLVGSLPLCPTQQ